MTKVDIEPIQPEEMSQALGVLGKAFATQPSSFAIYKGRTQADIERRRQITFGAVLKYLPGQVYVAKHDSRIVGVMRLVSRPIYRGRELEVR